MSENKSRKERRVKIRRRIRATVVGSDSRPRLSVYRSLKQIYVQAIDDEKGTTMLAVSSMDQEIKAKSGNKGSNIEASKLVGLQTAARLKEMGIKSCVFDRGGWRYHGRIKALADAIREGGITI
jgi:large subunit ribosomal protein L18